MHVAEQTIPRRRLLLLLAVLGALAATPALLAAQADVIRGRVTNTEGLPLPGVRVTATSIPGSVTREARTNNQGSYQIVFPGGPGDYMMGFALSGYDFRQFEIKRLADEDVLVADARLSVDPARHAGRSSRPCSSGSAGTQRTPDVSGTERTIAAANLPPEQQGDIAAMAASLPGVLLVPGLDGGARRVLGARARRRPEQRDAQRHADRRRAACRATRPSPASLTTSPYDPSRGGFSGAQLQHPLAAPAPTSAAAG